MVKRLVLILLLLVIVYSCRDKKPDTLYILSSSNNPTTQEIDIETGRRFSRSLENVHIQYMYYENLELSDNSVFDIVQLENIEDIEEKIKLPEEIIREINKNYPKALHSSYFIPQKVELTHLYSSKELEDGISLRDLMDRNVTLYAPDENFQSKWMELLKAHSIDIKSLTFSATKGDLFYLTDDNFNKLDSDLRKPLINIDILTEGKQHCTVSGYTLLKDPDELTTNYLNHLVSPATASYFYRMTGELPLRGDFNKSDLPLSMRERFQSIQKLKEPL